MPVIIPHYNNTSWYSQVEQVKMDRTSMLALTGAIEIALLSKTWKSGTTGALRRAGGLLAKRLLDQGLILSGERRRAWERVFNTKL